MTAGVEARGWGGCRVEDGATSSGATNGGASAGGRVFGNLGLEIGLDGRAVQSAADIAISRECAENGLN